LYPTSILLIKRQPPVVEPNRILNILKTQQSFLSGIRQNTQLFEHKVKVTAPPMKKPEVQTSQLHGNKVKVTVPPIKKQKFGTLGVLALR
jgi:hypothetical protein